MLIELDLLSFKIPTIISIIILVIWFAREILPKVINTGGQDIDRKYFWKTLSIVSVTWNIWFILKYFIN